LHGYASAITAVRVVPLQRDHVGERRWLLAAGLRNRRREVRRGRQDRIEPAVVVAGELHHQRAPGGGAGRAQRAVHPFRPRQAEPQPLERRHRVAQLLGERDLRLALGARLLQPRGGLGDRGDHLRVPVTEDDRAHAADEVDELVAVDVVQAGAAGRRERQRHRPLERAERGGHAACEHVDGPRVQRAGAIEPVSRRGHRRVASSRGG
jgi:hypothetical protein